MTVYDLNSEGSLTVRITSITCGENALRYLVMLNGERTGIEGIVNGLGEGATYNVAGKKAVMIGLLDPAELRESA